MQILGKYLICVLKVSKVYKNGDRRLSRKCLASILNVSGPCKDYTFMRNINVVLNQNANIYVPTDKTNTSSAGSATLEDTS